MNTYTYEELEVGMKESFQVTLTQEMQDLFLQITGDENPLHRSAEYAKNKGYEDKVVYGLLTSSFLSTLAGMYLPGERSLIHSVETKYQKPVYIGDTLTIEGEIDEKNDTYELIRIKILIRNQKGEKVVKGRMQVGVA
ncbi:MAG: MaoC family dehydratase [Lachnospiraceae bacterium]|nr:MaoC family dehydratase [Lachnospiraceae bacterium]